MSQITPLAGKQAVLLNRGLFFAKLYYLFFYIANGSLAAFFNVYLEQQGLGGSQIGWLASIPFLLALIANPFWGTLADRWQAQRLILAGNAVLAGIVSLFFPAVSSFGSLLLIIIVFYTFQIPLIAILDSVVIGLVKKTGQVYGRQRLWGSIGFIVSSFGLGQIVSVSNLTLIFQINAAFLAIGCGGLSLLLPLERSTQTIRIRDGLRRLAGQRQAVAFFTANTMLGIGAVSFLNFLGLHVLSLGGNESQVGLAYAVKALLEIPVMYLGARWFARYSYGRMIIIGYLGFSFVWLLIASATSAAQLIWIISLMGIAYAIYWVAAVGYASQIAPEGLAATAQSLVAATHYGLGGGMGAVAAGYIWDASGGSAVILFSAGMAALAAAIFYWGNR